MIKTIKIVHIQRRDYLPEACDLEDNSHFTYHLILLKTPLFSKCSVRNHVKEEREVHVGLQVMWPVSPTMWNWNPTLFRSTWRKKEVGEISKQNLDVPVWFHSAPEPRAQSFLCLPIQPKANKKTCFSFSSFFFPQQKKSVYFMPFVFRHVTYAILPNQFFFYFSSLFSLSQTHIH